MSEPDETPFKDVVGTGHGVPHPGRIMERRMSKFMREPPSVRLAANVIVTATTLIVVIGGVAMRVFDHKEYASVWLGMWWVLETVTTVGYGDLTPQSPIGKILTSIVMLWGVAFLAIITAAITSVFVARAQAERAAGLAERAEGAEATAHERFDDIDAQLLELRKLLEKPPQAT